MDKRVTFQYIDSVGGGKNLAISAIRLFAMLSIIACHICQFFNSEWAWWLNVGVQVFFIISGYLYGCKIIDEPIQWLKNRFMKILTPYYIFLTLAIVGYLIISPEILGLGNILSSYLAVGTIKGMGHLWFVSYILFCYIITPYLASIRDYLSNKNLLYVFCIITVLVGLYSIIGILIKGHFRPGLIVCYILGYYTAVFVKRIGERTLDVCFWVSLIPTIISNYVYYHLHYIQGIEMKGWLVHITDFSHALLGYSITMMLMILLKNIKESRILEYSDKYSYSIYLVHQLFILSPLTLLAITDYRSVNIALTLCAIIISSFILNAISEASLKLIRR